MKIYFYPANERKRINSIQHMKVDVLTRSIRRHYRQMRKAGMRPYQARTIIANMLFVGNSTRSRFVSERES